MIRALTLACAACVIAVTSADEATIRVSVNGRITRMGLEEYVARVVAGEGQPRAAAGAHHALAITARTYALANLNRHRREGFDLCDTTHCQVLRSATDATRRAADATSGRILTYRGQPASVYYSASCGGHSEVASQVWPGADDYSSHAHKDEACREEPAWEAAITADDIEDALKAAGHRGGRLRDVRVLERNQSGRVVRLRVDGYTPNEIAGTDFRSAVSRVVGAREFRSTAFEVRRDGKHYRFTGRGYGHGVGLCVIGAGNRASTGASADEILRFYFPRLTVTPSRGASTRAASAAEDPARPGGDVASAAAERSRTAATGSGDAVLLSLPGAAELERAVLAKLLRAARDDIAKRAAITTPPEIRVIVHPTIETFARATGQAWWANGFTDGSEIHLAPVSLLRQRGQLERTIRHEVAHALVDASLNSRPMWVREGAALYFGEPLAIGEAPARGGCPKDDELLQPISAGAYRSALSRADACFRRAVASGKRWVDVR